MMNALTKLVASVILTAGLALPADGQNTYVVGTPGAMDSDTARTVLQAVVRILDEGSGGDQVRVYDAWNNQFLGGFTIAKTDSVAIRRKRASKDMNAIVGRLQRATSVRSGQEGQVRLPQFLQLVSSGLRRGTGDIRVIVFGGPYYTDTRDEGFTFGDGVYPGDGFILAEDSVSIYGTAGRNDLLSGCVVHYCYLDDAQGSLTTSAVRRFWHLLVTELGGSLSSFGPSSEEVVRNALNGVKDPVSREQIDRTDTALEMRRVGVPRTEPKQPVETSPLPAEAPASEPPAESHAQSIAPHLMVFIDGSSSMGEALTKSEAMLRTAVTTGASVCGEVRVSVVVYRGPGEADIFPLTAVRGPRDGRVDEGMSAFLRFVEAKEVRLADEDAPDGFRMVSRLHPRSGIADLGGAMKTGLMLLRASAAKDAALLVAVCGDRGPFELGNSAAVELDERRTAAELTAMVSALTEDYAGAQVLSIYTGDRNPGMGAESAAFFEGIAKAAGDRGEFAEAPDVLLMKALGIFTPGLRN